MSGKVGAYYNEFDPKAAAWLRELIKRGLIADGEVDTRSIADVAADDVRGFTQCHWFAGIGVWSYGLRLAGWPDDRPVWTGSCPCPPFSAAGKKKLCPQCAAKNLVPHVGRTGVFVCCECDHEWLADPRHLWPELWRLVRDGRPSTYLGEQVASPDGITWLATVRASLEMLGYAVRSADLPAAGFGAPHIRQRLWIVADADGRHTSAEWEQRGREHGQQPEYRGAGDGMVNASGARREGHGLQPIWGSGDREGADMRLAGSGSTGERLGHSAEPRPFSGTHTGVHRGKEGTGPRNAELERSGGNGGELVNASRGGRGEFGNAPQPGSGRHADGAEQLGGVTQGDTERAGLEGHARHGDDGAGWPQQAGSVAAPGITGGAWSDADLIWCRDRKWRPTQSGIFPLVDGAAKGVGRSRDSSTPFDPDATSEARTMRLRGYGNAVTSANVTEFVAAAMPGEHRRTE